MVRQFSGLSGYFSLFIAFAVRFALRHVEVRFDTTSRRYTYFLTPRNCFFFTFKQGSVWMPAGLSRNCPWGASSKCQSLLFAFSSHTSVHAVSSLSFGYKVKNTRRIGLIRMNHLKI